jgi:ABC-2 type transport system permease protein
MRQKSIGRLLKGLYAMWYREVKVFLRERSRLVSAIFMPLFWLFIFGEGVGSIVTVQGNYQLFIFPGFLAMTIIFSSLFNGAYLVWDKKVDFLKEVLVSPLSRTTVFFGKAIGGISDALLQAIILMVIGLFLRIPFTPLNTILTLIMLIFLAIGLVSLGLIIGSFMESPEGFGLVASFAVYPMFLLSGALYPLSNLAPWLQVLTHINPATYAVDGLRDIILGASSMTYWANLGILIGFDVGLVLVGAWAFNRMKL